MEASQMLGCFFDGSIICHGLTSAAVANPQSWPCVCIGGFAEYFILTRPNDIRDMAPFLCFSGRYVDILLRLKG